ncbi:MAG TPA: cell division protein ZipA C-terminal FtsZ-binding domain-containing protein [Burkholderiaceae bacterium]|nr:cell division protein ZipA C-terminal FtsZ-binding domain-containing protein [Burkholderiaceae bacterium]
MTDLQASLMAIGGAILLAVVSYNKWQEYKAKRTVERAFSSTHDDVLMERSAAPVEPEMRQEPSFVDSDVSQDAGPVASNAAAAPAEPMARPVEQKELPVDELIDCVIPLVLAGPTRSDKVLAAIQPLRHVGNKPVHFIGQREDGSWEPVTHGSAYAVLCAGVQLANRHHALNEIEYSELVTRLRQVADVLDAEPDIPDMTQVMLMARELHQFVNEYDAQLSVNILSQGAPWAVNTLLAALERQGFDLRPDGRLIMPDGDGGALFSLLTNVTLADETTSRLTLLLDVPCVTPSKDGFSAMISCAKMLAARLDGAVVDDGGQPLSDVALKEIAEQVAAFHGHMEEANVAAGSTRALRLFS